MNSILFSPLLLLLVVPLAYAEVTSFSMDQESYQSHEKLSFVGFEDQGRQEVFIIIRDSEGLYKGMLSDPQSEPDGAFETIPRDVDQLFTSLGEYTATAFTGDQKEKGGITIVVELDQDQLMISDTILPQPLVIEESLTFEPDRREYNSGESIIISGELITSDSKVLTVIVVNENEERVFLTQLNADDVGTFSGQISTIGWDEGDYVISTKNGIMLSEERITINETKVNEIKENPIEDQTEDSKTIQQLEERIEELERENQELKDEIERMIEEFQFGLDNLYNWFQRELST